MTPFNKFTRSLCMTVCLGTAAVLTSTTPLWAQGMTEIGAAPAATEGFSFEIGHSARADSVYSINATQPATSKLSGQKIRLKIVDRTNLGTTTRFFTLATGKYKTVAQLNTVLAETFHRFLAAPAPLRGQELGKIGDLNHGGEVRFVVVSADVLRFDNLSQGEPARMSEYTRTDVAGLLAALTGTPAN